MLKSSWWLFLEDKEKIIKLSPFFMFVDEQKQTVKVNFKSLYEILVGFGLGITEEFYFNL